jgi:hypothetical protein
LSDHSNPMTGLCADLVRALERARSKFAVAVATESKRITKARLRELMETETEMRAWVKELRCLQKRGDSADPNWGEAIRAARSLLTSPPESENAQSLSDRMKEIMSRYQRRN